MSQNSQSDPRFYFAGETRAAMSDGASGDDNSNSEDVINVASEASSILHKQPPSTFLKLQYILVNWGLFANYQQSFTCFPLSMLSSTFRLFDSAISQTIWMYIGYTSIFSSIIRRVFS